MSNSIKEIIDLIKKTGDNCVVVDSRGQFSFVILPFNDYKKIIENRNGVVDLTEEELLDKINRDVALWKAGQPESDFGWQAEDFLKAKAERRGDADNLTEMEAERYYFEPIE